jgi:hypothetical protein
MSEIEPGEGWRLIDTENDTPKEGDEFWSVLFQEWGPLTKGEAFLTGYTYRRRIPAKPEAMVVGDSNGPLATSAALSDCCLVQIGGGRGAETIVLSGTQEIRQLADWLTRYADWREAQDQIQQE